MHALKLPIHAYIPLMQTKQARNSLGDTIKLLKALADSRNLKVGRIIHAQLIVTNQTTEEENIILTNSLINLYGKCGKILLARQLFDGMSKRNVVSWSTLMAGHFHNGLVSDVVELFKTMVDVDQFAPNEYVLATVLSSCSEGGLLSEGQQCHCYVVKSGLIFHQYMKNVLINMYSRNSDVAAAIRILHIVPGSDAFSYNSMINGLLEHGYLGEALQVLCQMVLEVVAWDNVTFVAVFSLCARLKDLNLGLQVHNWMIKTNVECDLFVGSALVDMYGRCGKLLNARKVFEGLKTQNVVLKTAMIAAYFQNGCFEEALSLFLKMEKVNLLPNEFTFAVLLNSCAGLSVLKPGDQLHARIQKSGFKDHVIVGNALINMYSKSGDVKAANEVFSSMQCQDSVTWNTIISAFSLHGLGKEALSVFHDMLAAEEHPDYITFVGVLAACGHLGKVREGFYYLNNLMNRMGVEPGLEHYTCIVGLLSKAGLLDDAENFMRSTPIKWDVIAWRTLLTACHVHCNYGLGRRVADVILQMDPDDTGTYILLSNMYAKARRWDGVVKMRKLMKERNIKKEPGVSWIELGNITHVFVAEDSKHPESIQIYEKVTELLAKIKPLGYVPDTATVLRDVEEEQKENCILYHSEKLAIAYGIMKMPSEAPLRVIKNLRMCDDCHSAVKLISKVTSRHIIVRDANRFHSFQDGHCSCADYW